MMARPLLAPDELKSLPKGTFIVSKTGTHPMKTQLRLFLKWGITFEEPYVIEEKATRKVKYADKEKIEKEIIRRYQCCVGEENEGDDIASKENTAGTGNSGKAGNARNVGDAAGSGNTSEGGDTSEDGVGSMRVTQYEEAKHDRLQLMAKGLAEMMKKQGMETNFQRFL